MMILGEEYGFPVEFYPFDTEKRGDEAKAFIAEARLEEGRILPPPAIVDREALGQLFCFFPALFAVNARNKIVGELLFPIFRTPEEPSCMVAQAEDFRVLRENGTENLSQWLVYALCLVLLHHDVHEILVGVLKPLEAIRRRYHALADGKLTPVGERAYGYFSAEGWGDVGILQFRANVLDCINAARKAFSAPPSGIRLLLKKEGQYFFGTPERKRWLLSEILPKKTAVEGQMFHHDDSVEEAVIFDRALVSASGKRQFLMGCGDKDICFDEDGIPENPSDERLLWDWLENFFPHLSSGEALSVLQKTLGGKELRHGRFMDSCQAELRKTKDGYVYCFIQHVSESFRRIEAYFNDSGEVVRVLSGPNGVVSPLPEDMHDETSFSPPAIYEILQEFQPDPRD